VVQWSLTYQVVQVADRDVAENEHEAGQDDLQVDVLVVLERKTNRLSQEARTSTKLQIKLPDR